MKLKILYLILFILIFIPIGICEIIKDDINLNNTKIYDNKNKIISIYDKNIDKSMDIKLISTLSDIDKLIKIVEITNYIEYIPKEKQDFITKTKKVYGKNDIYKIEYFIEKYNYTFDYIIINETIYNNKTGKNETKLINKSIIKDIKPFWIEFKPYNKSIFKNETFKLKIIHYKKPELGFFKIQTIPIFKNIECKEFTWWDGNWNLKRPIIINNINGDNVTNYQLKSVNLSEYEINASSARIINESSGLIQNHWNQLVNSNGDLEYVWCNFSKILNNTWVNSTYYIYYQSVPNVESINNGNKTFIKFDDFSYILVEPWIEEDLPNRIIIDRNINKKIKIDGMQRNEDVYMYQSKNINSSIFHIKYYSDTIQDYYAIGGIIGISDTINDISQWNNGIAIQSYDNEGQLTLRIIGYINNIPEYGNLININQDTNYWLKIVVNNTNAILYIYSDIGMENLINLDSINTNDFTYSYIYAAVSTNIGQTYATGIYYLDNYFIRKYTNNEPELWSVGNIEYPEGLNMTCNLKIITHLTNKKVQIVDMNASIVNESYTNECINLSYDSYIVYMSNPIKTSSFTGLLNMLDNFLVQFLLFIFLIIIATLFYVFIQIVKKKGFKL